MSRTLNVKTAPPPGLGIVSTAVKPTRTCVTGVRSSAQPASGTWWMTSNPRTSLYQSSDLRRSVTRSQAAPECARLVEHVRQTGLDAVAFKKWSLPTVAALRRPQRFAEVRRTVGATARALTLTLKDLVDAGVVERRVHDDFPPRTSYRLNATGRALRSRVVRVERALEQTPPDRRATRRRVSAGA